MAGRLKQLLPSRTQLRFMGSGTRGIIYSRGPHEPGLFDFLKWCPAEPGYTVVAVDVPRETPPEAFEDLVEDLAACTGILRLIPARAVYPTLEFGDWLSRRLGRPVVAHEGTVTIVRGGLYVAPSEAGGTGWLRFEPGGAPVAHSRRFPRPGWECEPFAEPYPLGPHAMVEPLPAGVWIRPVGESPDLDAYRDWLLDGMVPDPLVPRVVLGYPGSAMPPLEAVGRFWRSLPALLQPTVRFSVFGGADRESSSYGQRLADVLDTPVVLGNGVQLAEPTANGGYELRTVLRRGMMAWSPYAQDLGYLPTRSTGGVAADPVLIGHRAPIDGLQEREPGVYEYSHDAVLEVTQSGLWMRPSKLPADSHAVRTKPADPAHPAVVFEAETPAVAHRMQLLATEMMQRLEHGVRRAARILASPAAALATAAQTGGTRAVALDRPRETETVPGTLHVPAEAETLPGESSPSPALPRPVGITPAALTSATPNRPLDTLLARFTADAEHSGVPPAWLEDLDNAPPPAVAMYTLDWAAAAETAESAAHPVSAVVAEPPPAQPPITASAEPAFDSMAIAAPEPETTAAPTHPLVSVSESAAVSAPEAVASSPAPGVSAPVESESDSSAPTGQFTVARRRRKGRALPAAAAPDGPAPIQSTPAIDVPSPTSVVPPAPEPVEEPEESIQYGAFQLVSSSTGLSSGVASAVHVPVPDSPTGAASADPVPPTPTGLPEAQPRVAAANPAATGAPAPAKSRSARSATPIVRVQPVPAPQCSVLPREGGLEKERGWLRRNLSKQYDATASSVARILSEHPGLRVGSSASDADVLTDLVALRLYLTGKISGLDAAVRAAQLGPHVPLARCVGSGLRRLPSYRGPLRTRAALTADQVRWYGGRSLVTEWSFLPALASSNLDLPGDAEILIWSMTGRRTDLVDPSRPDQVVFQPGTSFKVLGVESGQGGPELRLRELTRTEVAPDGTVQSVPALDEFAAAALDEAGKAWRQADPVEDLPADRRDWFASPPGLLAHSTGGAKEGGKA